MNRIIVFCSLLTISFGAMSEPQNWMKKEDPNSMGLFAYANGDCPFKIPDLKKQAEGEYLRARIKPTEDISKLSISILASCLEISQGTGLNKERRGYAMTYSIDFTIPMALPVPAYVSYRDSIVYGGIVVSGSNKGEAKTYFLTSIREDLSIALTDYLKANLE